MGICASCLGLDRHPSREHTETEGLLDSRTPSHYGAIDVDDAVVVDQDDEEDVRHERQALEQISARAADEMIDVVYAEPSHRDSTIPPSDAIDDEEVEDAEQAWLQDLPVNEMDQDVAVKGSYAGNLVIDPSQLRDQDQRSSRRAL